MVEASSTARLAAATALSRAAAAFPEGPPVPLNTERLSPADRALATAIHRTTLQRWLENFKKFSSGGIVSRSVVGLRIGT